MEQLIQDSITVLEEDEDNLEIVYGWMDTGDLITAEQRGERPFTEDDIELINEVNALVRRVKLVDNIVLYRGIQTNLISNIIEANQFNAASPNLITAGTYGPYIMQIIVPKGSNAFYISAWESFMPDVSEQEEKEVLLLPGRFTLVEKKGQISAWVYTQY